MWQYRFDLVFSYWIFAWWILYELGWVYASPKLALILGIIENVFLLFLMIFIQSAPWILISVFIAINLLLKGYPLYTVYKDHIYWKHDLWTLIKVFALYLAYVWFSGKEERILYLKEFYEKKSATAKPSLEATPGLAIVFEIFQYMGWKWT